MRDVALLLGARRAVAAAARRRRTDHRRAARHPAARARSIYFWNEANPGERPDPGPQHARLAVQHRRGGLRALGDLHRHRSRLGDARRRRAARVLTTLQTFWNRPQGTARHRHDRLQGPLLPLPRHEHGDARRGARELSTIDTALLFAGILDAQAVLQRPADPTEIQIRALADSIYYRADWDFMRNSRHRDLMGWKPEPASRGFGTGSATTRR